VKLLLDQNISPKLVIRLNDIFPGSLHVQNVNMDRSDDSAVWDFAAENNLVIVSKDVDFSERSLIWGFPPKIIWIRRGNCSTTDIENILRSNLDSINQLVNNPKIGVLILI
jgi:predicted nuclease of predicted toxin-antitoxin system